MMLKKMLKPQYHLRRSSIYGDQSWFWCTWPQSYELVFKQTFHEKHSGIVLHFGWDSKFQELFERDCNDVFVYELTFWVSISWLFRLLFMFMSHLVLHIGLFTSRFVYELTIYLLNHMQYVIYGDPIKYTKCH